MARKTQQLAATGVAGNVATDFTFTGINPWRVLYGQVTLTTNATVANRFVSLQVLNASDVVLFETNSGIAVTASLTNQNAQFMPGVARETALVDSSYNIPIPHDFMFPPNFQLRVSITGGVAGDSYEADFSAIEFKL